MLDAAHFVHSRDAQDDRDLVYVPTHQDALPPAVDLRDHFPPAYNQGKLHSCSANAVAAVLQCLASKLGAPIETPSRLFIYWNERTYSKTTQSDDGSTLRNGIKAVAKFGACTETLWPYDPTRVCTQPDAACFDHATQHALQYASIAQQLDHLKAVLADGYPFVFGMQVYPSMFRPAADYSIPLPAAGEVKAGDHAVTCTGYDDARQMFLIRNSVGTNWGDQGYFYMPYAYALDATLAYDFWAIQKTS